MNVPPNQTLKPGFGSNSSSRRRRFSSGGGRFNSMGFGAYNGQRIHLQRPSYDPIDTSGITGLQKRIADSDRTAGDPLSAPGVQQQLATISEGLNRQFQSEKGAAMSTAAQSGQAGFGGAFAQTSAGLSSNLASTKAQTQSDMMMDVYNKARQEGMDATSALSQAQSEVARIKNERSRIDADITAQEAQLQQDAENNWRQSMIEQARLAEDARQFDYNEEGEDDDRDWQHKQDDLSFGFRQREEQRQARQDAEELRRNSLSEQRQTEQDQRQTLLDDRKFGFDNEENDRANIHTDIEAEQSDPIDEMDLIRRGFSQRAINEQRGRNPRQRFGSSFGFRRKPVSRYNRGV